MKLKRFGDGEGAQALVEFAIVLPVLLLMILGLLDLARAVAQENTLAFAAREGTRYAIVHGSLADSGTVIPSCQTPPGCTNATITDVVTRAAIGVPNITVTIGYPDPTGNNRESKVWVEATAPFVPLPSQYLLNGALSITLRGGSQLVIQR